jgi:hypothetical protein
MLGGLLRVACTPVHQRKGVDDADIHRKKKLENILIT